MKYQMKIRSVPSQPVADKQKLFLDSLVGFDGDWGISSSDFVAPDFGTELSSLFPLGKLLGKGIKGAILYRFRGGLTDTGECDDSIDLEFNAERADIHRVIESVFPHYCQNFDAYFGYVGNEEYVYTDFDASRGLNTRNRIIRVHQANYFGLAYLDRITHGQSKTWLASLSELGWNITNYKKGVFVRQASDLLSFDRGEEVSRKALETLESINVG